MNRHLRRLLIGTLPFITGAIGFGLAYLFVITLPWSLIPFVVIAIYWIGVNIEENNFNTKSKS